MDQRCLGGVERRSESREVRSANGVAPREATGAQRVDRTVRPPWNRTSVGGTHQGQVVGRCAAIGHCRCGCIGILHWANRAVVDGIQSIAHIVISGASECISRSCNGAICCNRCTSTQCIGKAIIGEISLDIARLYRVGHVVISNSSNTDRRRGGNGAIRIDDQPAAGHRL